MSNSNSEQIEDAQIFQSFIAQKTPRLSDDLPVITVFYGPPASGKDYITQFIDVVAKRTNQQSKSNNHTIDINVDAVIDLMTSYKKQIEKYVRAFNESVISPEYIKKSQEIYFHHRARGDAITSKLLDYAIAHKIDVRFETTGNNVEHLISVLHGLKGKYKRIVVYPIVHQDLINQRLKKRAKHSGRYPSPDVVQGMVSNAQHNLEKLHTVSDRLIVLDNTGYVPSVVVDLSRNCDLSPSFKKMINPAMARYLTTLCDWSPSGIHSDSSSESTISSSS